MPTPNSLNFQNFVDNISKINFPFGTPQANQAIVAVKTAYIISDFDYITSRTFSGEWLKSETANKELNFEDLSKNFLVKKKYHTSFQGTAQYNPNVIKARSIADFHYFGSFWQTFHVSPENHRKFSIITSQQEVPIDAAMLITQIGELQELLTRQRLNIEFDKFNYSKAARWMLNGGMNFQGEYLNTTTFFDFTKTTNPQSLYDTFIDRNTLLRDNYIQIGTGTNVIITESAYAAITKRIQTPANYSTAPTILQPFASSDFNGKVDTQISTMSLNGTTVTFKTIPTRLLKLEGKYAPIQDTAAGGQVPNGGNSVFVDGKTQVHALFTYESDKILSFRTAYNTKYLDGKNVPDTEMDTLQVWFYQDLFIPFSYSAHGAVILDQPANTIDNTGVTVAADLIVSSTTAGGTFAAPKVGDSYVKIDLSKITGITYTGVIAEDLPVQVVLELNNTMIGYGILTTAAAIPSNILVLLEFDQAGIRTGTVSTTGTIAAGSFATPFGGTFPAFIAGDKLEVKIYQNGNSVLKTPQIVQL